MKERLRIPLTIGSLAVCFPAASPLCCARVFTIDKSFGHVLRPFAARRTVKPPKSIISDPWLSSQTVDFTVLVGLVSHLALQFHSHLLDSHRRVDEAKDRGRSLNNNQHYTCSCVTELCCAAQPCGPTIVWRANVVDRSHGAHSLVVSSEVGRRITREDRLRQQMNTTEDQRRSFAKKL